MTTLSFDIFARDHYSKDFDKLTRQLRSTAGEFGGFADRAAKSFLSTANSLSNIPTAAAGIQGVATTVAGLSGVLGLIPAAGAGAVAAIGALKLGVQGFGDAIKAGGDPEKFAESLKTLAPSARDSAVAVRDLRGSWETMQNSVQEQLFEGLADDIKKLGGTYIPVLGKGMAGIASEFNYAAQKTSGFLAQGQQVSTVSAIFGSTKSVVGELAQAMTPLVSILLDVVAVGTEFLPGLADGFGGAAKRAAEFVHTARESGQLGEWISTGLQTVGKLVELFGNLGSIAATVFTGLNAGGASMLDTLISVTGKVREFLQSFEGQQALKAVGQALNAVSTVVTQVMLTAFKELAPVIVELAPGFAELAKQVGSVLVSALRIVGPLLVDLAGFISDNIDWLGPLAIALFGAVKAFQAVAVAMNVLKIAMATNPWLLLIGATIALAVLIVTHWDKIVGAIKAAIEWIVNFVKNNWELLISIILGPLGVIIALIVTYWDNIVGAISHAISAVVGFVEGGIRAVVGAVEWLGALPGRVAEWFGGIFRAAVGKLGELVSWVGSLPGKILGAIGDLGGLLVRAGEDMILGLLRGIGNFAHKIGDKIRQIAKSAWDAVTDFFDIFSPSKKMAWAGEMVGAGFVKGIAAMEGPVVDAADRLANAAWFPPAAQPGLMGPPVLPVAAGAAANQAPPVVELRVTGNGGLYELIHYGLRTRQIQLSG